MASAFHDKRGWIADFLPLGASGKTRRRVRVPEKYLQPDPKAGATAFACECDRYCRLLESNPYDVQAISHAHNISAITDDQAEALLGYKPIEILAPTVRPLSILDAALMHPSTIYERDNTPREYMRHRKELAEFLDFARIETVAEVSLVNVQNYIQWLKSQGYQYHGIRHRLIYVRRACRIGTTVGIVDPLTGWKLNRSGPHARIQTWSLDELKSLAESQKDIRALSVIYLGGFMGLRSSEIIRLQANDIHGDVLSVGEHGSKNDQSRRKLPIAKAISETLEQLDQAGTDPLIRRERTNTAYDQPGFDHWLHPILNNAPKCLRKAFATWGISYLPPRHVEAFLGHSCASVGAVTDRHYLADLRISELRQSAKIIDRLISK